MIDGVVTMLLTLLGACLWVVPWFIEFDWKYAKITIRIIAFLLVVVGIILMPTPETICRVGFV